MQYLRLVLTAGVLFAACGCSELAGDLGVSKPEQIRCQAGPDCDLKWERAYTWVVENSGLELKTKTDGLIKTAESPRESSDASCHYHQKSHLAAGHLRDRLHWKMFEYIKLHPFRRGIPHKICKFCFDS